MTKTLVEIWRDRNKPLLSERGLTLILRERGLSDTEIKQILKEISFKDLVNKSRTLTKKTAGAAKSAIGALNIASGKLTGKAFEMKATSKWKKYAAGAGFKWDSVAAEEFLEWLESTYEMPDFLIDNLELNGDKLVNLAERDAWLTKQGVESLLKQVAKEEFKYQQSQGRYGKTAKHRYDDSGTDTQKEFKRTFLKTIKDLGIEDDVAAKLNKRLIQNPEYLNQLLNRVLKSS